MLLDGKDDTMDLPFTPGPKEHEVSLGAEGHSSFSNYVSPHPTVLCQIIHFQSDPQRSILLMGRR